MTPRHKQRSILGAVLAGAAYGLLVRVAFEWKVLHAFLQIVSIAFLIVCPFSVGAIAVLRSAGQQSISLYRQFIVALLAMSIFLVAMFATLLEGLICLVLVAPVFIVAALIGGFIAGIFHNYFRATKSTVAAFALLPLLLAPVESFMPPVESVQSVTNTIHISASPERVFSQIGNVRDIRPEELGTTFVHFIGLPKPVAADMRCNTAGCVRTSHWEKNVWFQEVITEWDEPNAMHYRFVIPSGGVPREALDRHVEIGGEYFDLIDGGYDLTRMRDGSTKLSLTTRFVNKSQLRVYGDLWGKMVLKDFHRSILHLMKLRSERA
ncbi:MAG: hypothetical protein ACT6SF_12085 [Hydrogenophaga sp.]|jgi:hypothetical protein|uniref:hypothetical protein n=1 Tax=Hydrogenophaga sp. TaxID=1904254 RepID=UPI0025C36C02|nr:hypothetical protein [Hydrogenophaga sp.]MBW0182874.1 hypothetical protein [Hydrogenophaga sp.]